jgi:hypothetical protein
VHRQVERDHVRRLHSVLVEPLTRKILNDHFCAGPPQPRRRRGETEGLAPEFIRGEQDDSHVLILAQRENKEATLERGDPRLATDRTVGRRDTPGIAGLPGLSLSKSSPAWGSGGVTPLGSPGSSPASTPRETRLR